MVIQRVHYAVKKHFAQQRTLEFLWRQSWDSSPRSDITCHMMPFYSYDVPHTCGPNPSVCCQFDFQRLGEAGLLPWRIPPQPITEQNVQERALLLLDQYRQKSRLFRSPVLLVPLGDDFRFVDSSEWDAQFSNYQKLFDYFDQHPELHIKARFGTLSDYFEALHRRLSTAGTSLPTLRGDFFTYADRDDHYWSGYFTSRPFYKRLDRTLESTLRATEILFSLTLAEMRRSRGDGRLVDEFPVREHFQRLMTGRRNLALFQHHDAVTGTARDPVVVDYGTRLFHSILNLRQVLQSSAHWLLLLDKSQYHHDQSKPFLQMDDVISAQDALPQKTPLTLSDKPRGSQSVQSSSRGSQSLQSSSKSSQSVQSSSRGSQLLQSSSKGSQSVQSSSRGSQLLQSSSKGSQSLQSSSRGSQLLQGSSKGSQSLQSSSKGSQSLQSSSKGSQSVQSSPKGSQSVQGSPKVLSAGFPKGSQSVQGSPKGSQSVQSSPKGSQSVQGSSKGSQSVHGSPKGSQSVQGSSKGSQSVQGSSKGSQSVQSFSKGSQSLQSSSRGSQLLQSSSKVLSLCRVPPEGLSYCRVPPKVLSLCRVPPKLLQSSSKGSQSLQSSSRGSQLLQGSSKGSQSLQSSSKGSQSLQSSSKGSQSVQSSPKGSQSVQGSPKGSQSVQGSPKGSQSVQGSPKGSQSVQSSPKGSQSVQGSSKGSQSVHGSPKGSQSVQGSSKGSQSVQGSSKGSQSVQSFSKGSQSLQSSSRGSQLLQSSSKSSQSVQSSSRGSQLLQSSSKGSQSVQSSSRGSQLLQSSSKGSQSLQSSSRGSQLLQGSSKGSQSVQGSSKGSQSLQSSSKGSQSLQSSSKGSQSVQGSPKGSQSEQGSPKGSQSVQSSSKGSQSVQSSSKGSQSVQGSSKGSQSVQSSPKGSQSVQGSPKGSQSVQGSSKGSQSVQGSSKGSQSVQSSSKGSQSVQSSPKGSQSVQSSPKGSQSVQGSSKGSQSVQGSSKGSQSVQGSSKEQFCTSVISVGVDSPDAHVVNAETGRPMVAQISAVWAEPSQASTEAFQLDFVAELPPLSLIVYHVTKAPVGSAHRAQYTFHRRGNAPTIQAEHFQVSSPEGPEADAPLSLSNKHVQIWSSPETGLLQKLRLQSGLVRQVQVQFLWYGTRTRANPNKSGAYLFLPGEEGAQLYSSSELPLVRVSRGPVFSDITSCFRHFTHRVRLYHLEGHAGRSLEISNVVDIRSEFNRELAMRIISDVANGNRFYSDLNSFQMQQRRTLSKLPLQANFYPMTSASFLQDAASRVSLLSAQSQAVASLKPGESFSELEVVLDRRLQQDDNRGLGQGVTDNKLTASLYHLLLEDRRSGAQVRRRGSGLGGGAQVRRRGSGEEAGHSSSLPCDIHLLNLRTLEDAQEAESPSQEVALLLHRKGFDCSSAPEPPLQCTWSAHEEVNLDDLFAPLQFGSVRQTGLTLLREDDEPESARQQQTPRITVLRPMEINAFRVEIS
ncbi:Alpha-mannosidase 2x [Collichthys lucidus]|uniref:mannosyl-oligosaccharide 1,3-1,6-alpha-mannosidase n=1 Tax=Collichthys lucidus TaxID=240159 RepID=A0A4U5VB61_COLLU|nr:Alpha-mannosidase 2x [Collichthys lucidus]